MLSGEFTYFWATPLVRSSNSLPPKAVTFPLTPTHGNITRPLNLSINSPFSRSKQSPVFTRNSRLYPACKAASEKALRRDRQKPNLNLRMISSLKPRLRKYCKPIAVPSTSLWRMFSKYFAAHSFTRNIDSRSFSCCFSSAESSRSCTSIWYLFASHFNAST